jgi:hypothetical protein
MNIKEIAAQIGHIFLPVLEAQLKELVEKEADAQVDKALAYIKELIPGQFDDVIIAQLAPALKAKIKAELLNQVDHIS